MHGTVITEYNVHRINASSLNFLCIWLIHLWQTFLETKKKNKKLYLLKYILLISVDALPAYCFCLKTYSLRKKSQCALKKSQASDLPIVFLDIATITDTASCRRISFASIAISRYLNEKHTRYCIKRS